MFTTAWVLIAIVVIALEVTALLNPTRGDTLSEHIWDWFDVRGKDASWKLRRVILLLFLVWLTLHLTGIAF